MYTLIYFSPTGNVFYLAKSLAKYLKPFGVQLLPLEFISLNQLESNEHLVVMYPIHGFNAPRTVKRFIRQIPLGRYKDVSLIGVGSSLHWMNGAASSDLRKLFAKNGYSVIVDEILAMPLTIILSFPDDLAYKLIQESDEKMKSISKSLLERKQTIPCVKGKSLLVNFLGKAESFASKLFGLELHAGKTCNSCGICWNNCPEKNIKCMDNNKPKFGSNCIMCMRCIYSCPEKTITPRFSKFLPIKQGYSLSKYLTKH
ncbi:MAG: hypothetical protein CVU43_10600 [Chloroflexi bacterium HGW-Chloroflexi-5]|jgi:ferredoxin|nr:MAG: hypothetical protein CVU43_10600 [Chloroflexi bacterium HGW-Chloroflexi-5]